MQPSQPVPPAEVLREALGLGSSLGLMHAIFESTLLGLNDIRPSAIDLAILVVMSVVGFTVLAVIVAIAALIPPFRAILGAEIGLLAFRRASWVILTGGYSLLFVKIISYSSGWGESLKWSMAALPVLIVACVAVFRKGQRALTPVCASAMVAAGLCALQLAHADWGHEPASGGIFAVRLLLPIGVSLIALATVIRKPARHPAEPIARGAWLLAVLVAVWAVFWVNLQSHNRLESLLRARPAPANAQRPNVILIVLDTVRADHLDLFGYERQTMPNLKKFARDEAQVAHRTYTPAPWTLPSHASMFTGLYPSAHGAHYPFVSDTDPNFLAYSIREDVPTLAEYLGSAGYRTVGIVSNYAMLSQFGIPRGFQHYDAAPGPSFFAEKILWIYRTRVSLLPSLGELLRDSLPAEVQGRSRMFSVREPYCRRAWEINILARRWLERHRDRPFFLFLNYMEAHAPYMPIPEDDERFAKRPTGEEWFGFPTARYAESARGIGTFTAQEIEFMKGQYDAELVSLDRELGRLFDYLKNAGFFENTLIFITTDHGEAFFEHGFPEHGNSLYQPEIDGFLLIRAPPSLGTIEASAPMQGVDIFPTVAAVMNEPIPEHIQGSPWGRGRSHSLSEVFCRSCGREATGRFRWPDAFRRDLVAVTIDGQKLIRSTHGPDEIYNLLTDPLEMKSLTDADREFLRRVEDIIIERNKRLVEGLSKRPEDKNLLEKLRSLGYIQ